VHSRRLAARFERGAVDALGLEPRAQLRTVRVGAHTAQHCDASAEPRGRHGLVAALAARDLRERTAGQRFAGMRQARRARHQVHVQTADHRHA